MWYSYCCQLSEISLIAGNIGQEEGNEVRLFILPIDLEDFVETAGVIPSNALRCLSVVHTSNICRTVRFTAHF